MSGNANLISIYMVCCICGTLASGLPLNDCNSLLPLGVALLWCGLRESCQVALEIATRCPITFPRLRIIYNDNLFRSSIQI